MKLIKLTKLTTLALFLAAAPGVDAHDGIADEPTNAISARTSGGENRVEAAVVVPGTVAALKRHLYAVEKWPAVFSDVRSLERTPDGSWSIDMVRFGHPHEFRIERTSGGVRLALAAQNHGVATLEYALQPIDATHSKLVVRFAVGTPPQLTSEQMLSLLRAKAQSDLADFSSTRPIRPE